MSEIEDEKSRITVGVSVRDPAQLGRAAYDVAEFVNVLREQTGVDYVIDIQAAAVGTDEEDVNKTSAIGFTVEETPEAEPDEDDEDEREGDQWMN
ncbi:hypothetical protein [Paenibacillus elgii]|uniref:hypothetical protein n=1 Tax=Paenibacillus elgii TaxID=189691 RepID=UPI000248DEE8|nr:hypothetical protein [Paenibacillus elgii]